MQKSIAYFVMLSLASFNLFGQESSRLYVNPSFGINLPVSRLINGQKTDDLIKYDDNSYYWQVLSATFFINKNWGLEATFQGNSSSKINEKSEVFDSRVTNEFKDRYYINTNNIYHYDEFNPFSGCMQRGHLGLVYRLEKNKFQIIPKVGIGITSFVADKQVIYLKEKNTNSVYELSYNSGQKNNYSESLTYITGLKVAYKFHRYFMFATEVNFSSFKPNIKYSETITNLDTKQSNQLGLYNYDNYISTVSFGVGVIYLLLQKEKQATLKK